MKALAFSKLRGRLQVQSDSSSCAKRQICAAKGGWGSELTLFWSAPSYHRFPRPILRAAFSLTLERIKKRPQQRSCSIVVELIPRISLHGLSIANSSGPRIRGLRDRDGTDSAKK